MFSICLVPPRIPDNVDPLVIQYLRDEFAKFKSKNTINVENLHGGKPWVEDYKHWSHEAAHRATARWRSCTSIDDGYMSTNDTEGAEEADAGNMTPWTARQCHWVQEPRDVEVAKAAGMLRRVAGQDGEQWWRQQRRDSDRGGQREG
ncbi:hypothetical protein BGW80DRAFT_1327551 [Lactifluus volemus]|nr:hypothetical protein BGW80DRAFT_1327551 [Lactifluus volemus]